MLTKLFSTVYFQQLNDHHDIAWAKQKQTFFLINTLYLLFSSTKIFSHVQKDKIIASSCSGKCVHFRGYHSSCMQFSLAFIAVQQCNNCYNLH